MSQSISLSHTRARSLTDAVERLRAFVGRVGFSSPAHIEFYDNRMQLTAGDEYLRILRVPEGVADGHELDDTCVIQATPAKRYFLVIFTSINLLNYALQGLIDHDLCVIHTEFRQKFLGYEYLKRLQSDPKWDWRLEPANY